MRCGSAGVAPAGGSRRRAAVWPLVVAAVTRTPSLVHLDVHLVLVLEGLEPLGIDQALGRGGGGGRGRGSGGRGEEVKKPMEAPITQRGLRRPFCTKIHTSQQLAQSIEERHQETPAGATMAPIPMPLTLLLATRSSISKMPAGGQGWEREKESLRRTGVKGEKSTK